ncbi:hypothetical protein KIH74_03905 [Kineosporia sp. J2-2]|uniref:Uncharacterized protein n=1 Tax=Kineosporia corallincola TaxID=2835133 RepID=A0ABS5TAG0_9ACTN|nr:hypothetical protein [Kineosporia corallincola]MBT0768052.1 hypothetical protein [Kineosporia corallincola]
MATPTVAGVLMQPMQSRAVHQFLPRDPRVRVHEPPQAVPVLALLRGEDDEVLAVVPAAVQAWSGDSVLITWAARRGVRLYSAWIPARDVARGEAASRLLDEFAFGGGQRAVIARFLAWRDAQPRPA